MYIGVYVFIFSIAVSGGAQVSTHAGRIAQYAACNQPQVAITMCRDPPGPVYAGQLKFGSLW